MLPAPALLAGLSDEELLETQRRWFVYGAELQAELARRLRAGAEGRAEAKQAERDRQLLNASQYADEAGVGRSSAKRWRASLGLPHRMTRAQWSEARARYRMKESE